MKSEGKPELGSLTGFDPQQGGYRLCVTERLLHVELPLDPDSAAAGRLLVGELADDLPAPVIADIALLTHELIMNGVRYGAHDEGAKVTLTIERLVESVRVEVSDDGSGFPSRPQEGSEDGGAGLGLRFVDALSDHWGVSCVDRTRVWFELALPSPEVTS